MFIYWFSSHKFLCVLLFCTNQVKSDVGHTKTNMTGPLTLKSSVQEMERKTVREGMKTLQQLQGQQQSEPDV